MFKVYFLFISFLHYKSTKYFLHTKENDKYFCHNTKLFSQPETIQYIILVPIASIIRVIGTNINICIYKYINNLLYINIETYLYIYYVIF